MKRDDALRRLSREHLNALLAAKVLREGDDLEAIAEVFFDFWDSEGRIHFRVEEEVLLPHWARRSEVDRPAVARMLEEHLAIRREAIRLRAGESTLQEAQELGVLLHDHVRFEERTVFPLIEEALDADGLAELGARIEAAEAA
jgi:hemerythrin-like domain-containing protein